MIVVTGFFRVAPEQAEAVKRRAKVNVEATRKEKGCLLYAYGEDILEPGLFRVVERWQDWESLDAHGESDHIAAWPHSPRRDHRARARDHRARGRGGTGAVNSGPLPRP